jgi:hypothetical protein
MSCRALQCGDDDAFGYRAFRAAHARRYDIAVHLLALVMIVPVDMLERPTSN